MPDADRPGEKFGGSQDAPIVYEPYEQRARSKRRASGAVL